MLSRRWISLGLLVLVACAVPALAENESGDDQSPLDFKGKVVLLILDQSNALEHKSGSEYLRDAVIQELGGRFFITGSAYSFAGTTDEPPRDWRKGSQIGIAWDKVQQFYVFSPEQMDEMLKKRMEEEDE
jgi:hypothetical protein